MEATLKTKALSCEVEEAKSLSGALLDRRIADLRQKVGVDKEVSLILKKDMLAELDNLKEGQVKAGKEAAKEFEKKAREAGDRIGQEAKTASGDTFVAVVDAGAGCDDAKVLGFAMEAASKVCPDKGLLLLSNAGGKLAILAAVPSGLVGKLSAKAWSSKVLDAIGGKGGGKDDRAMGQSQDPSKVGAALEVARSYP